METKNIKACTILYRKKNHPQIKVDRTVSHPPLLPDCRASHAAQAGGETRTERITWSAHALGLELILIEKGRMLYYVLTVYAVLLEPG